MWGKCLAYPRERGGTESLVIQTGATAKSDWTISIEGQQLTILKGGSEGFGNTPFEIEPAAGEKISLQRGNWSWFWWEPDVRLNGVPLPGSMGSAEGNVRLGKFAALTWCALALFCGLASTFGERQWGFYNSLSWNIFLFMALTGWFLMHRRVAWGSYLVIVAIALDALVGVAHLLVSEYGSSVVGAIVGITAVCDLTIRISAAALYMGWTRAPRELGLSVMPRG